MLHRRHVEQELLGLDGRSSGTKNLPLLLTLGLISRATNLHLTSSLARDHLVIVNPLREDGIDKSLRAP